MTFRNAFMAATLVAASATTAHASIYNNVFSVAVVEASGFGAFNAQPILPALCNGSTTVGTAGSTACATFTYSGALNFSNTQAQNSTNKGDLNSAFFTTGVISNYQGSGTVTSANAVYGTIGGFLASSGSISGYAYGSDYDFDLGVLTAGTRLTITHDDGVALNPGSFSGTLTTGPTSVVTETVTLTGTGDFHLYYTRQNGTPSILNVSVPEPLSLSVLGAGLVGMGLFRRRAPKA